MKEMPKPLKLIFCTDGIFPHMVGGMQRHSRLLVEALARTGAVDLTVIHPHQDVTPFPDYPQVKTIALQGLPGKRPYLLELHAYSKRVLATVQAHPDHLIYSQGLSLWADFHKVAHRCIVNPHGLEPYQTLDTKTWLKALPFRWAFDRIFRQALRVVSLGGRLTDILATRMGKAQDRIVVLPNATNPVPLPADYTKSNQGTLRFLFAGRFAENKGIDVLLKAVQLLHAQGYAPRMQVDLVGKGPLWEAMQAQYPLPGVNFLGFVPDEGLDNLYLDDQVFVLPTLFEGMPTVVLEAMARAMPILVTDVGATLELVNEQNGQIIPKQDPQALAAAMARMIELDSPAFAALSQASRTKFEQRFTWEAVAQSHLQLFSQVQQPQIP